MTDPLIRGLAAIAHFVWLTILAILGTVVVGIVLWVLLMALAAAV